jgi:hypothetical protein
LKYFYCFPIILAHLPNKNLNSLHIELKSLALVSDKFKILVLGPAICAIS